jgi:hypothetical protein
VIATLFLRENYKNDLIGETRMKITKDTRISAILTEYGDIAEVMEIFGVQRVGRYSMRTFLAKALTVEWAARIHRVPLDEFLEILIQAVAKKSGQDGDGQIE